MHFVLPTKKEQSLVDVELCSAPYWAIHVVFVVFCGFVTYVSIRINAAEQRVKIKYGINYSEGDVLFKGGALAKLVSIGFFGGAVAGCLGIGGGVIYNPAFLSLGVSPKVSSATGMFLVMVSAINTNLFNWSSGFLIMDYAFWISAVSVCTAMFGIYATD